MFEINDYIFDPDRLIFYQKDLPNEYIETINQQIKKNDKYEELLLNLKKLDSNNMKLPKHPINLIGICLTYNCQLRCNYCSYSSNEEKNDILSVNDVLAFVVEALKRRIAYEMLMKTKIKEPMRFFFTGGGEPTYNWLIFKEVVTEIRNKCNEYSVPCYFELTTNGVLNKTQQKFICENFNKVMLSYDGIPEIQDVNRRTASKESVSDIVETTIKYFMDNKMPLTVRSTIWSNDFYRLKDMYDHMQNNFNKIEEWSIMPILPSGRALNNIFSKEYKTDDKNFFDYFIDLKEHISKKHNKIYVSCPMFNNSIADYCCGATFMTCYWLMPDKTIINCIEAERFRTIVGKVENGNVKFFDGYKDHMVDIVRDSIEECKNCIAFRFCKGACPLDRIRDKAFNTNFHSYKCDMVKAYWQYIFANILDGKECFGWIATLVENMEQKEYKVFELKRKEE